MLRSSALLVAVALLAACAPESRKVVSVGLREEYRAALNRAVDAWNEQLGCEALERGSLTADAWTIVHELDSGGSWAGFTLGGYVLIAPDTVGPHAQRVFEHELGHRFGLRQHSDDPAHLMYRGGLADARGPESTGLTCGDVN